MPNKFAEATQRNFDQMAAFTALRASSESLGVDSNSGKKHGQTRCVTVSYQDRHLG